MSSLGSSNNHPPGSRAAGLSDANGSVSEPDDQPTDDPATDAESAGDSTPDRVVSYGVVLGGSSGSDTTGYLSVSGGSDADSHTGIPSKNSSVLGGVDTATLSLHSRVVVAAISGTLPEPADAWEVKKRLGSTGPDVLVISQDSYKSDFMLKHEGLHLILTYDICGEGMIIKNMGGLWTEIRRMANGSSLRSVVLGKNGLLLILPGLFQVTWKCQAKAKPLGIIEFRLQSKLHENKYHEPFISSPHKLFTKERHPHPLLRLDAMGTIAITTCGDLSWHSEHAKNTEKDTYRIKLEKELYVSSHSRIIRGDHSRLGRVAIKVVKPSKKTAKYVATESQQGRWKTEMEAMWYLDHPNIVKLIGCDSRISSLFMPYLSFPSLVDQVSHHRRRFTGGLSDVERILRGISSALEYLNERRIIHNNIKPGNILYDRGARGPILIDFGTATRHGDPVCHKGKCYYVPPEYYSRQNQRRGKEGDVFALGVIMLWLLDVMPLPDKDKEAPNFRQEKAWKNAAGNNAYMSSQWLDKISRQRSKLNKFGTESIVRNMLRFSPRQRITSGTLKEATSRAYQRDKS